MSSSSTSWNSVLCATLLLQLVAGQLVNATSSSPSSASAIVAEAVSGWHDLKIEGYSLTKGLGKGRFIRSETFVNACYRWCIKYYPDGEVSHGPDWIAMQVQRDDSTDGKDIMAKLSINLLDHDGRPVALHSKIDDRFDRYRPKDSTGFIRFMKKKDLEESEYLKDDCFSIRCHFTIKNQTRTIVREPRASPSITVPPSNLHLHLLDLLRSGHGADLEHH
ncbi:BTB/POZ and MATH domain-containing protein 1-like [Lolium perenne]|jgi:speckle-type POZ protein|uniref:BTB/POZ and MATH domain-containing protein 1-like n=1 Tax=Lolium perenne TaxID=4522 RepID=UPI0021F55129|nr:BTB/POZ and MATH domain-containing protein 1-like [Lolium perenne]